MTRVVTAEQRERIREGCKKRVMPPDRGANISRGKTHEIRTPDGVFPSVKHYAEHVGVAPITIYKRIRARPDLYGFVAKIQQK